LLTLFACDRVGRDFLTHDPLSSSTLYGNIHLDAHTFGA